MEPGEREHHPVPNSGLLRHYCLGVVSGTDAVEGTPYDIRSFYRTSEGS